MTCYHPLKAWKVGMNESGKDKYLITSYNIEWIYWSIQFNRFIRGSGNPPAYHDVITDFTEIPCGKCVGCRLKYSREWADRCMLEAKYHEHNYFITLTYNNACVHSNTWFDYDTGESGDSYTLDKRDLQLFWKRLRKNTGQSFRYYACGEYGDTTARPHYHAIVFGLKLDDLKLYKETKLGHKLYTSETLNKAWKQGYVIVADVTWETCAYVSRYVMKKRKGKTADFYQKFNMEPEFVLMSRRPGIGKQYYEDHSSEIYDTDQLIYSTPAGGKRSRPPKYFDRLYEEECPELMFDIKENRKHTAELLRAAKVADAKSDLEYLKRLAKEEDAKENSVQYLKRISI